MQRIKFSSITPRVCLWPLTFCLCATFMLSIGLTYRSNIHCFAGTCGEWLFPLQSRLHVVVWYLWISISVVFLGLQAFQRQVRGLTIRFSVRYVSIGSKRISLTACLFGLWICILYGIAIGVWWSRLEQYFEKQGGSLPGGNLLAGVAMTGHLADITMGMVLLPVSRHSALVSLFKISSNSTYAFHKAQAYVLFFLVLLHGLLYSAWTALYNQNPARFRLVLPVLNPTYLYNEVWPGNDSSLGIWRASLIFTGSVSGLIMVLIFFTSLPWVRQKHFNVFYFTHFLTIVALLIVCLHASTMFYCTLPGLSMWLLDWSMRIFELRRKLNGQLEALGNGWYNLSVALPQQRISGCACESPLSLFYIHHSASSTREVHPFTTITHLRTQKQLQHAETHVTVEFLFRQSQSTVVDNTGAPMKGNEWTNKIGYLIDEERSVRGSVSGGVNSDAVNHTSIKVRLEGPYFKPMDLQDRRTVVCLVAGTGLSGAIAIGRAFQRQNMACSLGIPCSPNDVLEEKTRMKTKRWNKCVIIWIVRAANFTEIPALNALVCDGLEIRTYKTGKGCARPDIQKSLFEICEETGDDTWAYISGPDGFTKSAEHACRQVKGLTWVVA